MASATACPRRPVVGSSRLGAARAAPGCRPDPALLHRIRDRTTFVELGRRGRRAREGPVTVTHLPDGSTPPRVAYSVGRRVGPAVVRNRVKRRLRAVLDDVAGPAGGLPPGPGAYLVSVRPQAADCSYAELDRALRSALERLVA